MRDPRAERGFTLVELLVTTAMALIVFAATLNVLDVFSADSQAMTQRNAAQDQARLGVDRIERQLRNLASSLTSPKLLERATPYDLVFQTIGAPAGQNTEGVERVRYCVPPDTNPGSPAAEAMIAQTQTWSSATPSADPWSSDPGVTIPCPDPSYPHYYVVSGLTNRYQAGSTCPAPGSAGTRQPARACPVFSYDGGSAPSDLSAIDTVGVDLFVDPTPRVPGAETELRSSAFLRNQQRPPVASFTYTPLGGGYVLLNGGTSYSPSGEGLSFSWSCSGGVPCSSTGAIFDWHPGPGTYTVTLTVTDAAGVPTTTAPQQVTVT